MRYPAPPTPLTTPPTTPPSMAIADGADAGAGGGGGIGRVLRSTIGVDPLTVTVSSIPPTLKTVVTRRVWPSPTFTRSIDVLKPGNSAWISYVPGGTPMNLHSPRSSVTPVRCAGPEIVIITPGITAP